MTDKSLVTYDKLFNAYKKQLLRMALITFEEAVSFTAPCLRETLQSDPGQACT